MVGRFVVWGGLASLLASMACGSSEVTALVEHEAGVVQEDSASSSSAGDVGPAVDSAAPSAKSEAAPPPDVSGDGSTSPLDVTAACSSYGSTYCSFLEKCQQAAFFQNYGTARDCTRLLAAVCSDRIWAKGAAATIGDVNTCTQDISQRTCALSKNPPSKCAFKGTLADGAPCRYDAQCDGALCKVTAWGISCGQCARPAAAGEPCHQTTGCGPNLKCSAGGSRHDVCVRTDPAGTPCVATENTCAIGLACVAGQCQDYPSIGQACDAPNAGCNLNQNLECLGGVCVKMQWVHEGDACDPSTGVVCLANLRCSTESPRTCIASPGSLVLAADCL